MEHSTIRQERGWWRLAVLVFVIRAACSLSATDAPLLPGAGITAGIQSRVFDGMRIDVVRLDSGSLTLITDTLGAWVQVEGATNDGGFHLRHRRLADLRLSVTMISDEVLPVNSDVWRLYLENVGHRLGPGSRIEETNESGSPGSIAAIAGLPTREALIVVPPVNSQPEYAERHAFAADDSHALLAVLSGPRSDVEQAKSEFQFFLGRLARQ